MKSIQPLLKKWGPLFVISSLGLFLELTVIRWLSAEVRLFAYFKNLPLLAAFLGLSVGFALVNKQHDYRPAFAPLLTLFIGLVLVIGRISSSRALLYPGGEDEHLWYIAPLSYGLLLIGFFGMVLIFFFITVFLFIPLGQATGEEMRHHKPIPAYIVNIVASLAGVWIFALISYLQLPPVAWFGLGIIGIAGYLGYRRCLSKTAIALYSTSFLLLLIFGQGAMWSPYQRLQLEEQFVYRNSNHEKVQVGYILNVQQVFYQAAIDLSPGFVEDLQDDVPEIETLAARYNLPYQIAGPDTTVLIVGSGMGNDVAAALRNGATSVAAVEIDPAIIRLGRQYHPEHPYTDPRVTTIIDDARSYLQQTDKQYDLIVFGLLDSHTLLSGLSNVRLDSFVYTIESFQQVREHLKEGGIATVTFAASPKDFWIADRLGGMLATVFGSERVFTYVEAEEHGVTFVVGDIPSETQTTYHLTAWELAPGRENIPYTTDDWPYLYMRAHSIPTAYWQMILVVALATLLVLSRSFPEALKPDWHFFLLGAAFLLIEFKSVTEFSLLFGTTWLVNAFAITGVLVMALTANLLVLKHPNIDLKMSYGLLFLSLLISYFLPLEIFISLPPLTRALVSMILLSLPLFFAGIIFSISLRRAGETARPLASNLIGSVAGGVLEYGSLLWGIKSLYLIAIAVYGGALIAALRKRN